MMLTRPVWVLFPSLDFGILGNALGLLECMFNLNTEPSGDISWLKYRLKILCGFPQDHWKFALLWSCVCF